jgi:hypothetical protein
MDVNLLLDRLERVRPSGPGRWMARCPAHQDRSPSLAIRLADDGRILVHCFSGCGAADVIAACGLQFGDLFPEPLETGQHSRARIPQPFSAADALRCLAAEAGVIAICAADIVEQRPLNPESAQRVELAAGRIASALEYVYGHR